MPLSAYQQAVRTNPTVDFIAQLATNEGSAVVNVKLPTRDPLWFLRAITIVSVQNLAWELQFFGSRVNMGPTLTEDKFISVWQFGEMTGTAPASPGYPFTTPDITPDNGFFHFYVDGNMMPIYDLDALNQQNTLAHTPLGQGGNAAPSNAELHMRLINRSSGTKLAGTNGALQVTLFMANQGLQA
jgi:hypothetical protein